jgi:hypothetical protein
MRMFIGVRHLSHDGTAVSKLPVTCTSGCEEMCQYDSHSVVTVVNKKGIKYRFLRKVRIRYKPIFRRNMYLDVNIFDEITRFINYVRKQKIYHIIRSKVKNWISY